MALRDVDDAFVKTLPDDLCRPAAPAYLEEPRGSWHGLPGWVALPRSVEDVSLIVRRCSQAGVGLVPYGGGTGLVGGQVKPGGAAPLILSLERMTAIRAAYPQENVLVAEAGAILADVQAAALEASRLFPLSLASEGTARVGGLLATNAGGVNVLRYGNARDLCLGLEAVMPDGSIWHGLKRLRKDNTGYDLRHLLIGSEGTLGVITAAALKLCAIPAKVSTAMMVVRDPDAALSLLTKAQELAGESISAFELLHRTGLEFLAETLPDIRQPFPEPPEWSVLIEFGMSSGEDPEAALTRLFEIGLEGEWVSDGLIAQSEAQRMELWNVREHIPEGNRLIGSVSSHDISLPISAIPEFLEKGKARIAEIADFRINAFGHLGDGNLHYNMFPPKGGSKADYKHLSAEVQRTVHDLVFEFDGSFSAEHGVGRLKVDDLERYGDPTKLAAMQAIKAALDPKGIMNPGAVLRG